MTKMTYVEALNTVLTSGEGIYSVEVMERLTALKAALEKRNANKSGKPTKAQREAAEFTNQVYEMVREIGEAVRCGDIANQMGVSTQKVSAALTKLVNAGKVVKATDEKRNSVFSVSETETEVPA